MTDISQIGDAQLLQQLQALQQPQPSSETPPQAAPSVSPVAVQPQLPLPGANVDPAYNYGFLSHLTPEQLQAMAADHDPTMSTGEDMARSAGAGVERGVAGLSDPAAGFAGMANAGAQKVADLAEYMGIGDGHLPHQVVPGIGDMLGMLSRAAARKVGADPTVAQLATSAMFPGLMSNGPTVNQGATALNRGLPLHEPQTLAGRYAERVGEFAPGAGMGSNLAMRLANVLVPAAASQTAEEAAPDSFKPWAGLVGGLLGGGAMGAAHAIGNAPSKMIGDVLSETTPGQLADATALQQRAADLPGGGIHVTPPEALGSKAMLGLQHFAENSPTGRRLTDPIFQGRPAQTSAVVRALADAVGPEDIAPAATALKNQDLAQAVIDGARQKINAEAKPFYDRLPGQSLPDDAFQKIAGNPSYAKALGELRANPELAPLLQATPPLDLPTRLTRAAQQGFETKPYYHGTGGDFTGDLQPSESGDFGPGVYVSESPTQAATYAAKGGMQGGSPNIRPVLVREGAAEPTGQTPIGLPAGRVVRDPADVKSLFDPFAPANPDNDLNVVNRVVQQLDQMKEAATPSGTNPQGNLTLATQRGTARALADALATEASPDWRAARDIVAQGHREVLDPMSNGPVGAIANAQTIPRQVGALYPPKPVEGAAAETAAATAALPVDVTANLTRHHLIDAFNQANTDNMGGKSQWAGGKYAATLMGHDERAAALQAGLGAVDPSGALNSHLDSLIEALKATGKRWQTGSGTAFNAEQAGILRKSPGPIAFFGKLTDPLEWGKSIDAAVGGKLYQSKVQLIAKMLEANPQDAADILAKAKDRSATFGLPVVFHSPDEGRRP